LGNNPPIDVAISLIIKVCVSMISDSLAAAPANSTELNNLCFAYNSIACKLFKVKKIDDINSVQYFSNRLQLTHLINYYRL